jgi:hypothetical protein
MKRQSFKKLKQKALLSAIWVFVTLNYLYCDIIGLMDTRMLKQYLTGTVGGMDLSPAFLFGSGILMEIPIAMVLLNQVLQNGARKFTNLTAGVIMTLVQVATLFIGETTYYYGFFSAVEIATTSYIVWYAWKRM